ncbi:RNA-binding ATPase activator esf2 [Lambiella insularis]|nr:RNA-binding ATPase activator esf2 [Lambiella insularis]
MPTRKRNDFLDVDSSDEGENVAQSSEEAQDARDSRLNGLSTRSSKRRKVTSSDEEASEDLEDDGNDEATELKPTAADANQTRFAESTTKSKNPKLKPLTQSQLASSQRKARKTGVIYLSRIPPFMRPSTVRHLLSSYGAISRLFLTPEPPSNYIRRIKAGGNKKRSFIDGWVEFVSKKDAKICAETLNGEIIGGKKGGWYHDDIWNIKYLKGFKWSDLMEQVQSEEKAREGRMRAELQREQRERKAFLGNIEAAKKAKTREEKRKKREGDNEVVTGEAQATLGEPNSTDMVPKKGKGFESRFRQNEVKIKTVTGKEGHEQPDDVRRVLRKIF